MPSQNLKTFGPYREVADSQLYNEEILDSVTEASQIVNNLLACYAKARRVQAVVDTDYETDSGYDPTTLSGHPEMVFFVPRGTIKTITTLPVKQLLTGAGRRLRVRIYYKTNVNQELNLKLTVGRQEAVVEDIQTATATFAWGEIESDCDQVESPILSEDRRLRLSVEAGPDYDVEITIRSMGIFEPTYSAAPEWKEIVGSSNVIGDPDRPYSAGMIKILNDNLKAVYGCRVNRRIMSRCYMKGVKDVTGGYDSDNRGLGMYATHKGRGITSLPIKLRMANSGAGGDHTNVRVEVRKFDGTLVDSHVFDLTGATPSAPLYFEHTFSGLQNDEIDYEIRIDGAQVSGTSTYAYLYHVFFYEAPIGSPVDHVLPEKGRVQPDDDVIASTWYKVRFCLAHLWRRATQILINDWRDNYYVPYSGEYETKLIEGTLYPTYGSKNVICRVVFSKPLMAGRKMIMYAVTAGNFQSGEIITGSSSGATGYVVGADTTLHYLWVKDINGAFINGETITGSLSGATGTVSNLPVEYIYYNVRARFALGIDLGAAYLDAGLKETQYKTVELMGSKSQNAIYLDFKVTIPSEFWNDPSVISSTTPLNWHLVVNPSPQGLATWPSPTIPCPLDHLKLHKIAVFEETPGALE
jgi:hypothetical protein